MINQMDMSNPVLAVALLTQRIAELEKKLESDQAEPREDCKGDDSHEQLSLLLRQRGTLLMAMGDKEGAQQDMQRYLLLNPEKIGELSGDFQAEGREHCH